ncbi:molecular chaperone TorD family protein [Neobacillus novalis]|uniref:Molecular chaperone TorD family protein n=1 Tax=Neobacillus novalis TaxID=220687 RepID=A0AA95SEF5_9BACI|nr:molecular chaperone TorD family protein [Neobacillus novalis]WHY84281.1 molecular chaperone TorD family protein [Neobacillus novalis]
MTVTIEPLHIQLQPYLLARKKFYQLLHLLFSMPANVDALFEIKKEVTFKELLGQLHEGGKILDDFFQHLNLEQIKREQQEFQRLFIGPGPLGAPPWESYYRSREQLLFEEWTYQIRERYHRFGLQYCKENNEPDDHLLLELEFMVYLSDLCLFATKDHRLDKLLATQISFLEEHLLIWIPYFCEKVIENTSSQLYLGAAMLLEDFLSFDLESLVEVREGLLLCLKNIH